MEYTIREKSNLDNTWIDKILVNNWGSNIIVSRRKKYESHVLNRIIAENDEKS